MPPALSPTRDQEYFPWPHALGYGRGAESFSPQAARGAMTHFVAIAVARATSIGLYGADKQNSPEVLERFAFVAGGVFTEDVDRGKESLLGCITLKPFDFHEINQCVRQWVGKSVVIAKPGFFFPSSVLPSAAYR